MKMCSSLSARPVRGFTLIEMLVVIAIIATLAGILLPVLASVKKKAKIKIAQMEVSQLVAAIHNYQSEYSRMPATAAVMDSSVKNAGWPDFTFGTTLPSGTLLSPDYPEIASYGTPTYQNCNAELIALLQPKNLAPPPPSRLPSMPDLKSLATTFNPRDNYFFHAKSSAGSSSPGIDGDGIFRDPWGNPYIVTLDLDDDHFCVDGFYGRIRKIGGLEVGVRGSVIVWSFGPDGKARRQEDGGTLKGDENKDNIVSWE